MKSNLIKIVLCYFLSLNISAVAFAYDEINYEKNIEVLEKSLSKLKRNRYSSEDLSLWTRLAIDVKSTSDLCISEKEDVLVALTSSIKDLGDASKGEDENVSSVRKLLNQDKKKVEKDIADCKAHLLSVTDIETELDMAKSHDFDKVYLSKEKNIVTLIGTFFHNPTGLFSESSDFLVERSGVKNITLVQWSVGFLVLALVIFLSFRIRFILHKKSENTDWSDHLDSLLLHSLITTSARYAPHILGFLVSYLLLLYVNYGLGQTLFITQFTLTMLTYFIFVAVISLFLSPVAPAKPILSHLQDVLTKVSHRLRVLFLISLLGYLAFYTVFSESLTETNLHLLRYVFSLFIVINLIWTIRALTNHRKFPKISMISNAVNLVLILSLLTEWMGYVNLSIAVRGAILISFILLILFFAISKILQLIFNSLDEGSNSLCRRIRTKIGVENNDSIPGLIWIRLTMSVMLWGGLFVILVTIWDYDGGFLTLLKNYLLNGFSVGEYHFIPGKILWALIVFSGLLIITGWIKNQLDKNWLTLLNIDSGAQNAMVTIAGYVMFLISALIGLSVAGFNFGNIAIVAGALSVGIGFGLQNIVNNFVSGLILLFERPIRKGDWVEVGSTEGFVKNIQIRSTLIRTFDNSDVIVPNSELISNQVTNWMLSSKKGRAIVPVGVAYGSDIEQVRSILLKVAEENDSLIHGENRWKPKVLFRAFGDSSLDFELRVFLKEINARLTVISDLNFAIEKAFREANIEIPFPQRDVHVKTLPGSETGQQ